MSEWKIGRKGAGCQACGREFEVGESFVSAIFSVDPEPGDEETSRRFERLDCCPGCFEGLDREPFSRWVTRRPPEAEKEPLLDLGMARDFLLRLAAEGDPAQGNLMHILSLLLLRKRKVKLRGRRVEGNEPVMDLVVPAEPEEVAFTVPAGTPGDEETVELEAEVARLFGYAPDPPPAEA